MAKNHDKSHEAARAPILPESRPPAPAAQVSTARIWVFWCGVALAVIAARLLNHMLPGISESAIERWVMLAFGAFLAVFLLKLK